MKILLILALFLLICLPSRGQNDLTVSLNGQATIKDLTGKVVQTMNLTDTEASMLYEPKRVYKAISTPIGIFITANFKLKKIVDKKLFVDGKSVIYSDSIYIPVNYLYSDGKLSRYTKLDSYVIYDYSSKNNTLLVGYWNDIYTFDQPKIKVISNFDLTSQSFYGQQPHKRVIWKASYVNNGESIKTLTDKEEKTFVNQK